MLSLLLTLLAVRAVYQLEWRWALVAALPDRMRAAVCLHYLADLTLRQVAETLSIREGTAKSRLHAGLRVLRRHFAEEPA